jgi:hypothetical protein
MRNGVGAAVERSAKRTGEREDEATSRPFSDLSTAAPARSSMDSSRRSTEPTLKHSPTPA